MKCYGCGAENWFSFNTPDQKFHSERELLCCLSCGNVSFRVEPQSEAAMKEYYRKEYRAEPDYRNLLTTTNKQNYVRIFLTEWLKGKEKLVTCDVGCATGYLPAWLRSMGHIATGCEYTRAYRRFSEHFYGIPLTEEIREDLRYDLITIYHVLEHMTEPDKKLVKYRELLRPGGRMLVSTPYWYETIEEGSGPEVTTFEHLWHKDHINVFSVKSLKRLFAKCGLVIEQEDLFVYGQSYLLRALEPGEKPVDTAPLQENPQEMIELTHRAKKAIELFQQKKFMDATKLWPKFPDAWIHLIFNVHGKDPDRQLDLLNEVKAIMPKNVRILTALSGWHYQRGEYKEASAIFEFFIGAKPDADKMMFMGFCLSLTGNHREAMAYFKTAGEYNPQKWTEAMNWLCAEACKMPTWDERAIATITESVAEKALPGLRLIDPLMEPVAIKNGNGASAASTPAPAPAPADTPPFQDRAPAPELEVIGPAEPAGNNARRKK